MTHLMIVQRQMPSVPAPRSNFARVLSIAVCLLMYRSAGNFSSSSTGRRSMLRRGGWGLRADSVPCLRTHNQVG